jgi:transposase-like protein
MGLESISRHRCRRAVKWAYSLVMCPYCFDGRVHVYPVDAVQFWCEECERHFDVFVHSKTGKAYVRSKSKG